MITAAVLTQPGPRARELAAPLRAVGLEVREWPMTSIEEAPGLDWAAIARTLAGCTWVLFPSPGAIEVTMSALVRHGQAWPAGTGIGLVGPGSREAVASWRERIPGLSDASVIEPDGPRHDAEALLERPELAALEGRGVAVLRRADGREAWLHALRGRGADLHAIVLYAARALWPPEGAGAWLQARANRDDGLGWSVASADAGERLAAFVGALPCATWALGQPLLVQHPRIARALAAHGWRRVVTHRAGSSGLTAAIESLRDEHR